MARSKQQDQKKVVRVEARGIKGRLGGKYCADASLPVAANPRSGSRRDGGVVIAQD